MLQGWLDRVPQDSDFVIDHGGKEDTIINAVDGWRQDVVNEHSALPDRVKHVMVGALCMYRERLSDLTLREQVLPTLLPLV